MFSHLVRVWAFVCVHVIKALKVVFCLSWIFCRLINGSCLVFLCVWGRHNVVKHVNVWLHEPMVLENIVDKCIRKELLHVKLCHCVLLCVQLRRAFRSIRNALPQIFYVFLLFMFSILIFALMALKLLGKRWESCTFVFWGWLLTSVFKFSLNLFSVRIIQVISFHICDIFLACLLSFKRLYLHCI